MDNLRECNEELLDELVGRMRRAELALNRHGFKDDGKEWHAPARPSWAAAVEMIRTLARAEQMIEELTVERDALREQVAQLQGEPA